MVGWKLVSFIVCAFGFFKELKPSEPYLTPYLRQYKNLTSEEVNNQIYPVWTYSYLAALFVVFLLTDLLRYKPVIVFEGLCYITTWLLLLFTEGVIAMQMMQFSYGLATATEVAYYAYIYAVVSPSHYRQVAGLTRAAVLTGKFVAYLLSQFLVSFSVMDFRELNFISLASVSLAFLVALGLPGVRHSAYFHKSATGGQEKGRDNEGYTKDAKDMKGSTGVLADASNLSAEQMATATPAQAAVPLEELEPKTTPDISTAKPPTEVVGRQDGVAETMATETSDPGITGGRKIGSRVKAAFVLLWTEFRAIYSDRSLLMWAVWWALAACGNFQVGNYIQNLWDVVSPGRDSPHTYNGAVEAAAGVLGSLSALAVGWLPVDWDKHGELLLGLVSAANSAVLCVMATASSIWLVYCLYAVFRASFQMVITVATFQIASRLSTQSYGLAFGFNTFMSLALETVLTAIVVDKRGLDAPVTTQFLVYGGYFGLMGLLFLGKVIYNCLQRKRSRSLPMSGN